MPRRERSMDSQQWDPCFLHTPTRKAIDVLDILDLSPDDDVAIQELVCCIKVRLKPGEVDDFLFVIGQWERSLSDADALILERYQRARIRGEMTPALMHQHLTTVARLARTPEWKAVVRWQRRIKKLTPLKTKAPATQSRKAA